MWRSHRGGILEVALAGPHADLVTVARDAVAHIHRDPADAALRMMEVNTAAEVRDAADVSS
ncbi:hypothetical protein ACFVHW_09795 [Streptomyces sp. NPDC127110]|uniref:hypothetical protein n=1 Tax=Streptomyces sp. NPDC127110 TaxID=3345362 RepID=UPI0036372C4A